MLVGRDTLVSLKLEMHDAQNVPLAAPAERYGEGVAAGMQVGEDGRLYTVTDIAGGSVVLDANHPLAGMALRFSVIVLAVRAATQEELSRAVSLP